jgi:hypothetical protein
MHTFVVICLIAAALAFAAEVVGVAARVNLVALGLLAVVLSLLVPALQ